MRDFYEPDLTEFKRRYDAGEKFDANPWAGPENEGSKQGPGRLSSEEYTVLNRKKSVKKALEKVERKGQPWKRDCSHNSEYAKLDNKLKRAMNE